jgi:hypothetical protein
VAEGGEMKEIKGYEWTKAGGIQDCWRDNGYSLADQMRQTGTIPFEVYAFLKGTQATPSYFSGSGLIDYHNLGTRLAHAHPAGCKKLTGRHTVLCIYRDTKGKIHFKKHRKGACPYLKKAGYYDKD